MTGLQDSQWQRQFVAPCCHHAVPAGPPGSDRGSSGRWVEPDDSGYCVGVFVGGRGGENINHLWHYTLQLQAAATVLPSLSRCPLSSLIPRLSHTYCKRRKAGWGPGNEATH